MSLRSCGASNCCDYQSGQLTLYRWRERLQVETKESLHGCLFQPYDPKGARQQSVGDIPGRDTGSTSAEALGTISNGHDPRGGETSVIYVPPENPAHQPIYEQLKEIGFLGKVREFLSPVQLPRTLLVKLEGCDGDANASYEKGTIVICYEYIDELWKTVPEEMTEYGVMQIDALAGPLLDTILHEVAHAMFDMLRVPVLGREEDARDQVAAYIMLQVGKAQAHRLIEGAAYAYKTEAEAAKTPPGVKQFASAHGTPAQRLYNLLCLAYGADPQLFGNFVEKGYLPKERAEERTNTSRSPMRFSNSSARTWILCLRKR
jgi:Putative metallopeptidase